MAAWFLILALLNKFWLAKLFPPKVNLATLKERRDREEKSLYLNKPVKLGVTPTKSTDLARVPTMKGT